MRASRLWGRHGLVASQLALTLVLLTVTLSFYRAFEAEYGGGPGFLTERMLLTSLDPGLTSSDSATGRPLLSAATRSRGRTSRNHIGHPGVDDAA